MTFIQKAAYLFKQTALLLSVLFSVLNSQAGISLLRSVRFNPRNGGTSERFSPCSCAFFSWYSCRATASTKNLSFSEAVAYSTLKRLQTTLSWSSNSTAAGDIRLTSISIKTPFLKSMRAKARAQEPSRGHKFSILENFLPLGTASCWGVPAPNPAGNEYGKLEPVIPSCSFQ